MGAQGGDPLLAPSLPELGQAWNRTVKAAMQGCEREERRVRLSLLTLKVSFSTILAGSVESRSPGQLLPRWEECLLFPLFWPIFSLFLDTRTSTEAPMQTQQLKVARTSPYIRLLTFV